MGKPMILVSSVTYAMKGRDLLFRHGIRAYVARVPGNKERVGCGYGLVLPQGAAEEAEALLAQAGLHVLGRGEAE